MPNDYPVSSLMKTALNNDARYTVKIIIQQRKIILEQDQTLTESWVCDYVYLPPSTSPSPCTNTSILNTENQGFLKTYRFDFFHLLYLKKYMLV